MTPKLLNRAFQRKYTWIYLGILTLLIRFLFSLQPNVAERLYSRGLFLGIRWVFDHSFAFLPFNSLLLLLPIMIFIIVRRWVRGRRRTDKGNFKQRFLRTGRHLLSLVGALVCLFFFLWGFNYQRVPVREQLSLSLTAPDSLLLERELRQASMLAEGARLQIPGITADTLTAALAPEHLEAKVASDISATLGRLGFPASGRVRARLIRPGGWMLSLNVAGIYNPFTGEGNVSTALTDPQIPFTMAHEMAHGYGFGDEGTCNFWALLACAQSSDPYIRYSGRLTWWLYLARELNFQAPATYRNVYAEVPAGLKADLAARRNNSRKYAGRASRLGSIVNDQYLKLQGVEKGIESYNQVVLMYLAWTR